MRPYIHNPAVFRAHFTGQGLPAFKGKRLQRGNGSWITKLKRVAVPLLMAGASAVAPHLKEAAQRAVTSATQRIFPNNPAMQRVVGKVAGRVADHAFGKLTGVIKKRKQTKGLRRPKKHRGTTRRNIFT